MFKESFYKDKMNKSLDVFSKELQSLRTGRANSNMLDLIKPIREHNNSRTKND